jgi:hypothetical protein
VISVGFGSRYLRLSEGWKSPEADTGGTFPVPSEVVPISHVPIENGTNRETLPIARRDLLDVDFGFLIGTVSGGVNKSSGKHLAVDAEHDPLPLLENVKPSRGGALLGLRFKSQRFIRAIKPVRA